VVVTLLVSPDESERVALAAANGKIQLSLRGQMDQNEVDTTGVDPKTLVEGAHTVVAAAPKAKPKATHARVAPTAPEKVEKPAASVEVVEVFHGHKLEERKIRPATAGVE
jgi:Flp pilus assembly protein CpaB